MYFFIVSEIINLQVSQRQIFILFTSGITLLFSLGLKMHFIINLRENIIYEL